MGKSPHDVWGSTFDPKPIPDHKPRPWEKVCPNNTFVINMDDGTTKHPRSCPTCRGSGYVPMTTGEMLDALARHFSDGYWCLECDCGVCWRVAVLSGDEPRGVPETVWHDTPDDAMRAALEAVG